jgi:hypothetical protein
MLPKQTISGENLGPAIANQFQALTQAFVFTCRPADYLAATSMVPDGAKVYADTNGALVRAIDLERALGQPTQ